ncbi:hypothetical protein [Streptomyces sp. NPDC004783]|uniref:hypothetical protein n=1 Tax=Streptomyces sp. NPDC004783 TaxID=3154459 RepID=UPI0033BF76DB
MPAHAAGASCGTTQWRRLVSALRGTLVVVLMLCAVVHGMPEETHGSVSVPAAASVTAAGGEPHGPHMPHGIEDCASDMIARTADQSIEDLPLGAMALVVLVAVSLVVGKPLAGHETRRRSGTRTGRVALVRTSRWRI